MRIILSMIILFFYVPFSTTEGSDISGIITCKSLANHHSFAHIDTSSTALVVGKKIIDFCRSKREQKKFVQKYQRWSSTQFQQEMRNNDDQHEILSEYQLYQFKGFREFIKTLPEYEAFIKKLHNSVSRDYKTGNRWWRNLPGFSNQKFTDIVDILCHNVNEAQQTRKKREQERIKQEKKIYEEKRKQIQEIMRSQADCLQRYAQEYALKIESDEPTVSEKERIFARGQAIVQSQENGYRCAIESYTISQQADQLLRQCSIEKAVFERCDGSVIQQQIHQEMIAVLDQATTIRYANTQNRSVQLFTDAIGSMTCAAIESNHAGQMQDALSLADCCWAFLDYSKAIVEGAVDGALSAVNHMAANPVHSLACAVAGEYVLAYHLAVVLHDVFDIGITYASDPAKGYDRWQEYTAPLNCLIDAITDKELSIKEKLHGGARVAGYLVAQGAALNSINRVCKGAQKAAVEFVRKNPLLQPEEFAVTADGLMYKVAQDIDRGKPKGKYNAWSGSADNAKVLKAHNMKQFFNEFEFGKLLKDAVTKTNKRYKGQAIYRIEKDINSDLKKGYQMYLDSFHYDHLEVFDKGGFVESVFNLDGTKNINKTDFAIGQARRIDC